MTRYTGLLLASAAAVGASAIAPQPYATAQDAGWKSLIDAKSLDNWNRVGEANRRIEDGAIVAVAKVDPMPRAGGKWNTYEITAKGPKLTVILNGQKSAEAENNQHAGGFIALQYGSSVVKFRKVEIKPL